MVVVTTSNHACFVAELNRINAQIARRDAEISLERLSNKPFLTWSVTTPPHLKYVATVLCNLSSVACFLTLMFHKVVWPHTQGAVWFLITSLLQIYQGIFQWKKYWKSVQALTELCTTVQQLYNAPRHIYSVGYSRNTGLSTSVNFTAH